MGDRLESIVFGESAITCFLSVLTVGSSGKLAAGVLMIIPGGVGISSTLGSLVDYFPANFVYTPRFLYFIKDGKSCLEISFLSFLIGVSLPLIYTAFSFPSNLRFFIS
jgi:hypothetical protein